MNAKEIKDVLATRPFEPVEFVLSSGDRYVVKHPENVMLFKERVLIAYFDEPGDLPDRSINISYLHVAAIEPLLHRQTPSTST